MPTPAAGTAIEWLRLSRRLDAIAPGAALDGALDEVERTCREWPDAVRLLPGKWLRSVFLGRAEPRLRVARAIEVQLHDPDVPGDRLAWATSSSLAHLTVVRVLDPRLGDRGLARWLGSGSHGRLRDLALGSGITPPGAAALARDARLLGVERLALHRNDLGPEGVARVLSSPHLGPGLRTLLLGRTGLGAAGAAVLRDHGANLTGLRVLDLDACRLGGDALQAVVGAPILRTVTWLNLSNNPIGREGCLALARSQGLGGLRQLFLHGCDLGDDDVAELLRAPMLAGLDNLALSGNRLTLRSVRALADRRDLALGELDICHNAFPEHEALRLLGGASQFAGLRRLCA